MTPPRLVLDTNVLVSALVFQAGLLSWLRVAWRSNEIRPLAREETTAELIRVLAYSKFGLSAVDQSRLLAEYRPYCETVAIPDPPPDVPECHDPSDSLFLELAIIGKADTLVTGDRDLLALAQEFPVPILAPAVVERMLSGERYWPRPI